LNGEMGTLSSHQGSVDCNIRVYPCLSVVQRSPPRAGARNSSLDDCL
jgi:hypothetical protein